MGRSPITRSNIRLGCSLIIEDFMRKNLVFGHFSGRALIDYVTQMGFVGPYFIFFFTTTLIITASPIVFFFISSFSFSISPTPSLMAGIWPPHRSAHSSATEIERVGQRTSFFKVSGEGFRVFVPLCV